MRLGAEYVVFHVSDVSMEECFTYRFSHTNNQVIDAALELINELLPGKPVVAWLYLHGAQADRTAAGRYPLCQ